MTTDKVTAEEVCMDCKFYYLLEKKTVCRRYPPLPVGESSNPIGGGTVVKAVSAWPEVAPKNWCGDFKKVGGA